MYRNVFFSFISTVYATVLSLAIVPLYLTQLGEDRYGLVGIYLIALPVITLLDLGFGVTALRESARVRAGGGDHRSYVDLMRGLEILFGTTFVILSIVAVSLSGLFTERWLNVPSALEDEVRHSAAMMFVCLLLRWFSTLYRGRVNGFGAIVWLSSFTVFISTLRFGVALFVIIFASHRLEVFFGFQLIVGAIELAGYAVKGRLIYSHSGTEFSLKDSLLACRKSLAFTASVSVGGLIWVLAAQLDKFLLMPRLSLAEYGLYSLAIMLAGGISVLAAPVNISLLPALSERRASGDMETYRVEYRRYGQLTAVILLPIAALFILFPQQALIAWTGNSAYGVEWSEILQLYVAGNTILAFSIFGHYSLIAFGDMRLYLIGIALFALTLACIMGPVIVAFGALGAAYTWLGVNVAYLLLWVQFVHSRLVPGLGRAWLYQDILPIGFAAALPVLLLKQLIPLSSGRVEIFMQLATCGIVALASAGVAAPHVRTSAMLFLRRHSPE
jgi:O-antigen/teichoic acid export membrane protein